MSYAGSGAGSRPVRVDVTDEVGNATACTYTGAVSCRPASRVAPVITRAALDRRAIRAVGSDARAAAKVARRAVATVVLSADAKVTFTFRSAGRRKVRLVERLDAGRNAVTIRARLGAGKVLRPGRWTVVVSAENKAGHSRRERLHLRVVR